MCPLRYLVRRPCHLLRDSLELTEPSSWLIYKMVDIIRQRAIQHGSVIVTGVVTNVLLIISILSAIPWVRKSVFAYLPDTPSTG